jgi:hypothetical protein
MFNSPDNLLSFSFDKGDWVIAFFRSSEMTTGIGALV